MHYLTCVHEIRFVTHLIQSSTLLLPRCHSRRPHPLSVLFFSLADLQSLLDCQLNFSLQNSSSFPLLSLFLSPFPFLPSLLSLLLLSLPPPLSSFSLFPFFPSLLFSPSFPLLSLFLSLFPSLSFSLPPEGEGEEGEGEGGEGKGGRMKREEEKEVAAGGETPM